MTVPRWKAAWITGASSGIGRALALRLAGEEVEVVASARRAEELASLAAEAGAGILPLPLDVTDAVAAAAAAGEAEERAGPIDLVVLCAGLWRPFDGGGWSAQAWRASMEVNYLGATNVLAAMLPRMTARGRGHVALVGSVAGYRGLPKALYYGPTKAAMANLAECLRLELDGTGVSVSLVSPGFVATPMTAVNRFPMPFLMQPAEAAERILAGLRKERFEIAFPRRLAWPLKAARCLPAAIFLRLAGGRRVR